MSVESPRYLKRLLADWTDAVAGTSFPQPPAYFGPDVPLSAIVEHTDSVIPGACFIARVRTGTDGHPYIGQAVEKGAALIIGQRAAEALEVNLGQIPYLQVEDSAEAEAWFAAAWYGFPARQLVVTGITGTDGKTTTVNILFNILKEAGIKVGMLSTLRASAGEGEEPLALHVTTPEAPVVQRYLRQMVDAGLSHCVLEVTSHGLAQERVGAIEFDVAVVTNVTHEHLDYHGDYEHYLAAKARLFGKLRQGVDEKAILQVADERQGTARRGSGALKRLAEATAVLNRDDNSFEALAKIPVPTQLTYGIGQLPTPSAYDVSGQDVVYAADRTRFKLVLSAGEHHRISSRLVGPFNVYNMLAASAAAHALGIDSSAIRRGIESLEQLTGRMQRVDRGQPFMVVVDFAHTPNALEQAISAGRSMTTGKLITVFGSAGKRDVEKRRLMAELSSRQADFTILTAEDPRTESLTTILQMMAEGCVSQGGLEGQTFWRIQDRGEAIHFAMSLAQPGDLVLICGKGHEQSMCFGTTEYAWDDVRAAQIALDAFLAGNKMPDLGLPTYDTTEDDHQ